MRQTITAIITKDEIKAQNLLINKIAEYCPDIKIHGKATSTTESLSSIYRSQPNLVFMDVELADGSSFDILENIHDITFKNNLYKCI